MKKIIFSVLLSATLNLAFAQKKALNIPGLWQLTGDSKSENKLQNTARTKQSVTTANEEANKTLLAKFKETYQRMQQRFGILGLGMNAANVGIQATPIVNRIIADQGRLFALARKDPAIITLVYGAEIDFADRAHRLLNFLIGLCLSIGDVNQMKAVDRKCLFDYIVSELSVVGEMTGRMVRCAENAGISKAIRGTSPFEQYVAEDKAIIADIFNNAKYLRQ